jgi:hypothetical protein
MVDQRAYSQNMDVASCTKALQDHFLAQGYEIQVLGIPPEVVVQVRKRSALRAIAGMANALTAEFRKSRNSIAAAVGAVGAIVFAPLLVTAAYGAWKQSKLPDQFWHIVDKYGMACPKCGTLYEGSKFCSKCGVALV